MEWLVYDALIFLYLIGVAVLVMESLGKHRGLRGKSRGYRILLFFLVVGWVVIFYGSFVEPRLLVVRDQEVVIGQSGQQVKTVVVADFHVGPYKRSAWVKRVVREINLQKPDLVFISGDFIYSSASDTRWLYPFKDIQAPLGVFAVTGNHDYKDNASAQVIDAIESYGVRVLRNESVTLEEIGLTLAGVSDIWFEGDLHRTMRFVDEDDTTILLAHNPDAVKLHQARKADLIVSGHTHGGQIRLPWYGPIGSIPTLLGKDYLRGLFRFGDTSLFITSGVGESGPRARLLTPPEIVNLTVHL